MPLVKFSLRSLAEIDDGRILEAFAQAMRRCEADCVDRPDVEAARTVKLEVRLTPVAEGGELASVDVNFRINDNVPKRESRSYNMRTVGGQLVYNEASPDEVRQLTLDMAKEKAPRIVEDADPFGVGTDEEAADAV